MSILRRDAALQDLIDLAYHIALDDIDAAYRSSGSG
jgi:plasmid stabilization system protein ParE